MTHPQRKQDGFVVRLKSGWTLPLKKRLMGGSQINFNVDRINLIGIERSINWLGGIFRFSFGWYEENISEEVRSEKIVMQLSVRCSISLTGISDPCHFHFCPTLCLSLLNCCSFFSLSLLLHQLPTLFSPIVISFKYSADFMRWYHCNKLIESKP
jgi:hypothetical protein